MGESCISLNIQKFPSIKTYVNLKEVHSEPGSTVESILEHIRKIEEKDELEYIGNDIGKDSY